MPQQVPPDKTPGKIELTGRGNQISAVVRELLAGKYGMVPRERGTGGAAGVCLYIDSNRTRGECYKAYIVNVTATDFDTSSGTVALADIGNITGAQEVTFYNSQQGFGAITHVLTASFMRSRLVWNPFLLPCTDNGLPVYCDNARDTQAGCP